VLILPDEIACCQRTGTVIQ